MHRYFIILQHLLLSSFKSSISPCRLKMITITAVVFRWAAGLFSHLHWCFLIWISVVYQKIFECFIDLIEKYFAMRNLEMHAQHNTGIFTKKKKKKWVKVWKQQNGLNYQSEMSLNKSRPNVSMCKGGWQLCSWVPPACVCFWQTNSQGWIGWLNQVCQRQYSV